MNLDSIKPLFQALPYPCLLIDPHSVDYSIAEINAACAKAINASGPLQGRSIFDLYGGERIDRLDHMRLLESFAECIHSQEGNTVQHVGYVEGHACNDWEIHNTPVMDGNSVAYILHMMMAQEQAIVASVARQEYKADDIFNNNLLPLWIYEPETLQFLKVNDAAVRIYGYSREEFMCMTLRDIRPAEDIPKLERAIADVKGCKHNNYPSLFRHKKKNGEIIFVKIESAYIQYEGRDTRIVTASDITEELMLQDRLVESNKMLHTASSMANLGYWTNEVATGKIYWSDELYHIFELTPDSFELTLPNIISRFHPDDRQQFNEDVQCLFRGTQIVEREHRIITPAGEVKWILERLRLVRNDAHAAVRLEGIALDITQRKRDMQALKESNERFSLVMKAAVEAIIDWDIKNDHVIWGDGFRDLFGYNLDVYDNFLWSSNIHPEDKDRIMDDLERTLQDPLRTNYYSEFRFLKANREVAWVQHRGIFIRDSEGNAVRAISAMVDVTESMKRIREIERQNTVLREIAWIQSHVVRAPLASLLGFIDLFKNREEMELDDAELVEGILASAYRLDKVIHDIIRKSEAITYSIGTEEILKPSLEHWRVGV